MAKKSAIKKNETRIKKVSLMGKKRKALKDIIMNRELPLDERFAAQMKLNEMPRDGSFIRVRNRCLVTGGPKVNSKKREFIFEEYQNI